MTSTDKQTRQKLALATCPQPWPWIPPNQDSSWMNSLLPPFLPLRQSFTHISSRFRHFIVASTFVVIFDSYGRLVASHLHYACRLWHQLTLKLFEFFDHPLSKPFRVHVFEGFVSDFETKINQLRLAELGVKVSKVMDSKCDVRPSHLPLTFRLGADPVIHLNFLTSLLARIDVEKSKEAQVLLLATIAHAKLLYGDLEGTKSDMDNAWNILDHLSGVDNGVNAAYYGVAADYYKVYITSLSMAKCSSGFAGKSGVHSVLQELVALPCLCRCGH